MNPVQYERMWARGSRTLTILAVTHPTGALVFGASTVVLCLIAQKATFDIGLCIRLTLAVMCAQAVSGVVNDLSDIDLDGVAKPWRALPARLVSVRGARALAAAFLALGIFAAALVSAVSCLLLIFGVAISVLYSTQLKRTRFSWLPYVVAYPSLPVWVWISTGAFKAEVLTVYLVGAPLVIAVHLVNQLRDYEEDERLGVRGLVHALGKSSAVAACNSLLVVAPIPLAIGALLSPTNAFVWAFWGAALVHWSLVLPVILGPKRDHAVVGFRRLFRALQLSGPLLMGAWLLQM
jgi:4-hydroxybenzoate polyprenyltransferase